MAGRHSRSKSVDLVKTIRGMSVKTMASLLGLTVLGGGMAVAAIHAHTNGPFSTDVVSRPAVYQAASRSMTREDLLKESVSTDVTGTWSIGVSTDEVKRNLDAQTKSNDSAAAAKDTLRKALDEVKKLDVSGMTSDSVASLDKAKDKASKTLEGKTLRKASEYDSVRASLKKAVDGLVEKPVPVVQQAEPNGEGAQSSNQSSGSNGDSGNLMSASVTAPVGEIQEYAHKRVLEMGWSEADFTELVWLWNRESGWNPNAHNASSGAHGIPQCLGHAECQTADYQTNYKTQVEWGLKYIAGRYKTPSNAASHSRAVGWY